MTSKRPIVVVFAVLLVVSATSPAFVGMAAANHEEDDNPLDDILASDGETEDESGIVSTLKGWTPEYITTGAAAFDGQMQRFFSGLTAKNPFADPAPSNKEHAITFTNSVRIHEDTYTGFLSNATTADDRYDTHKVTFAADSGGDAYAVYLDADIENGTVSAIDTYEQDEFDEESRTVDVEWVVDGAAAGDLSALTADLAEHITEEKPVDRTKQAQLAGKYCDVRESMGPDANIESCDIRSSLWMDHDSLYEEVDDAS